MRSHPGTGFDSGCSLLYRTVLGYFGWRSTRPSKIPLAKEQVERVLVSDIAEHAAPRPTAPFHILEFRMPTLTEIVKLAATARDLFLRLESGSLAEVMSDVEFSAACEAIARVPAATHKDGQVLVCIGHLNSVYHANLHIVRSAGFVDRTLASRVVGLLKARNRAEFALCLRAICYSYLGDRTHCLADLDAAQALNEEMPFSAGMGVWLLSGLLNPVAMVDFVNALRLANSTAAKEDRYVVKWTDIEKLRHLLLQ
jgi:hypothetical protein